MKEFSNAKDYRQKILAIDRVIHTVHENLKERLTLPAACKLIEGNEEEILNLLDELAYGDTSTAGMKSTKEIVIKDSLITHYSSLFNFFTILFSDCVSIISTKE
jgi:hypothetical protein